MRKIFTIVFALVVISWVANETGCLNKFDINNTGEVKKYLMSNNFQHFEMKASMTTFLQFDKDKVKLTIYLGEKELTEKFYSYTLGVPNKDQREIKTDDNESSWKIKDDGTIYVWHKGDLFTFNSFGKKRKIVDSE